MLSLSTNKCTQIMLALSFFLLAPSTTFADDEKATLDALLLIASGEHAEAVAQLESLAAEGNDFAQLELSNLYKVGHFLPLDFEKAETYAAAARRAGNEVAIYFEAKSSFELGKLESLFAKGIILASCGLSDTHPELDSQCHTSLRKLASKGNSDALFYLKVDRSDPLADELLELFPHPTVLAEIAIFEWLREPSEGALAQLVKTHELGSRLAPVYIVTRKYDESRNDWNATRNELVRDLPDQVKADLRQKLRSLVDGEFSGWFGTEFINNQALGHVFEHGDPSLGITPDYELAFKAYGNCAKDKNDTFAGICLYLQANLKEKGGPNLIKSITEAVELYYRASARQSAQASSSLAFIFELGLHGIPKNFELAATYSQLAIDQGSFYEAERLAGFYRDGRGVEQDFEKAASLYEMAASSNNMSHWVANPDAMLQLAEIHEKDQIADASLEQALSWYRRASDAPHDAWELHVCCDESAVERRVELASEGLVRVTQKIQSLVLGTGSEEDTVINPDAFGRYVALVIANQSYQSLTDLKTPLEDAALIGNALQAHFGAEVEYLFNATRKEMLATLNDYRKNLEPTDNFILYYAGHGFYDAELNVGYWQPVDSGVDEDYTWVDTERISRTISGFQSRNALVIADSCFSGSVVRGGGLELNQPGGDALLALSQKKTRMAITSGGLQPVLDSTGNAITSAFASNLASVLSSVDRPMSLSSLFPTLRNLVSAESAAWGFEQVPEMAPLYKAGHDGGDFIFSPYSRGLE